MSEIPDKNENFESTYESTFKVGGYNQDFCNQDERSYTRHVTEPSDNYSLGCYKHTLPDGTVKYSLTEDLNDKFTAKSLMHTMSQNENGTLNLSSQVVGSRVPGGLGEDNISLNMNNTNGFWKYNEDKILKEVKEYLGSTYKSHYTSQESKTQTLDLIESIGDAEPFCRSNAIKYLSRFGKKNGKSKMDILKAIHYCILLYHFAGLCNENSQPYETF